MVLTTLPPIASDGKDGFIILKNTDVVHRCWWNTCNV